MVHTRFSEEYIYIVLMYTTHHIFPILLIKLLVNKDGEPTTQQKMSTGKKSSASNLCVLLFPCVVQKETIHVDTKVLNMYHRPQKGFQGILIVIPQHKRLLRLRTYYT